MFYLDKIRDLKYFVSLESHMIPYVNKKKTIHHIHFYSCSQSRSHRCGHIVRRISTGTADIRIGCMYRLHAGRSARKPHYHNRVGALQEGLCVLKYYVCRPCAITISCGQKHYIFGVFLLFSIGNKLYLGPMWPIRLFCKNSRYLWVWLICSLGFDLYIPFDALRPFRRGKKECL